MKKPNMRRRRKAPMGVPRVGGAKKEQPPMTSARREQLRVVFRRVIGEVKRLKEEEGEWHRWSEIENGVPVVDLLKHMNLVRLRLATNELLIFVIFYLIFAFICIQARGAQTDQLFKQSQTVKNGLFSFPGPLGEPRLFDEIEGPDDLWYFLRGPLPMTVFQSAWYNGDAMKKVETGYILHTLHAVGGYRLRQLRVRNDSCWDANEEELNQRKPGQWNQPDRTCYPVFSAAAEQTTALWGGRYAHRSDLSSMSGQHGYYTNGLIDGSVDYGTGGYVAMVNEDNWAKQMDDLYNDQWTDLATRAIAIDMSLYCTETQFLTVVRLVIEFFPSGMVLSSTTLTTVTMNMYDFSFGSTYYRVVLEGIFVLFTLSYWVGQLRQFCLATTWYEPLVSFTWVIDTTFYGIITWFVVSWLRLSFSPGRDRFTTCEVFEDSINECSVAKDFVDMWDLSQLSGGVWTQACLIAVLGGLRIFILLAITPTMYNIWTTLKKGMSTMAVYFFAFGVINIGFAFGALCIYGHALFSYHNVASSFLSLMLFVLGDFDYDTLSNASPEFTNIFFILYNATMVFVMLNVFIAIVLFFWDGVAEESSGTGVSRNRVSGSFLIALYGRLQYIWWHMRLYCCCFLCHLRDRKLALDQLLEGCEHEYNVVGKPIEISGLMSTKTTLADVKAYVFDKERIPIDTQRYEFCGQELIGDDAELWTFGIEGKRTLYLLDPAEKKEDTARVNQGGRTITLQAVPADSTVARIKRLISLQEGLKPEEVHLEFSGVPLADDRRAIRRYGVQSGTQIIAVLPTRYLSDAHFFEPIDGGEDETSATKLDGVFERKGKTARALHIATRKVDAFDPRRSPIAMYRRDCAAMTRFPVVHSLDDQRCLNVIQRRMVERTFQDNLTVVMSWSVEARVDFFEYVESQFRFDVENGNANSNVSVDEICAIVAGRPKVKDKEFRFLKVFWCARVKRCTLLRKIITCEKVREKVKFLRENAEDDVDDEADEEIPNDDLFECDVNVELSSNWYTRRDTIDVEGKFILSVDDTHFCLLVPRTRACPRELAFSFKYDFTDVGFEVDGAWHSAEENIGSGGTHSSVVLIKLQGDKVAVCSSAMLFAKRARYLRLECDEVGDAKELCAEMMSQAEKTWKRAAVTAHYVEVTQTDASLGRVSRVGTSHCAHVHCAARQLVESYTAIKKVMVLDGLKDHSTEERDGIEQEDSSVSKLAFFDVQALSLFGRKAHHKWVINRYSAKMTVFSDVGSILSTINLGDIVQIDTLRSNTRMLTMSLECVALHV